MSSEVWLNGLPPVGCECEFRPTEHALWAKVKVLAIAGDYFWLDYPDDKLNDEPDTHQKTGYFRPLKTKEQTEREEAINNVCTDLGIMLGTSHDRIDAAIDSMLKLGYHNGPKVNELSDEEIEVFLKGRASLLSPLYKIEAAKWAIDYILDKEE